MTVLLIDTAKGQDNQNNIYCIAPVLESWI